MESAPKRVSRKEKRRNQKNENKQSNPTINFTLDNVQPMTQNQKITFKAYNEGKHLMLHGVAGTGKLKGEVRDCIDARVGQKDEGCIGYKDLERCICVDGSK